MDLNGAFSALYPTGENNAPMIRRNGNFVNTLRKTFPKRKNFSEGWGDSFTPFQRKPPHPRPLSNVA
jgi:hypothetical protein